MAKRTGLEALNTAVGIINRHASRHAEEKKMNPLEQAEQQMDKRQKMKDELEELETAFAEAEERRKKEDEQMQDKRKRYVEILLERRKDIDNKLRMMGHTEPEPEGKPKKATKRTCPRCGKLGHRWNNCSGTPQESWWEDARGKEEKKKKS